MFRKRMVLMHSADMRMGSANTQWLAVASLARLPTFLVVLPDVNAVQVMYTAAFVRWSRMMLIYLTYHR